MLLDHQFQLEWISEQIAGTCCSAEICNVLNNTNIMAAACPHSVQAPLALAGQAAMRPRCAWWQPRQLALRPLRGHH